MQRPFARVPVGAVGRLAWAPAWPRALWDFSPFLPPALEPLRVGRAMPARSAAAGNGLRAPLLPAAVRELLQAARSAVRSGLGWEPGRVDAPAQNAAPAPAHAASAVAAVPMAQTVLLALAPACCWQLR